jgi:membrane protein DedA with SNARE-associated domain
MRFTKFLLADALAGLISLPIMMWLGYQFSNHFDTLLAFIKQFKLLTGLAALIIIAYIVRRIVKTTPRGA